MALCCALPLPSQGDNCNQVSYTCKGNVRTLAVTSLPLQPQAKPECTFSCSIWRQQAVRSNLWWHLVWLACLGMQNLCATL